MIFNAVTFGFLTNMNKLRITREWNKEWKEKNFWIKHAKVNVYIPSL